MDRFKRYFPIPYILVGSIVCGVAVWRVVEGAGDSWAWVGVLLSVAPLVGFLLSLGAVKRARTWRNQGWILALAVVGTGIAWIRFESPASWIALGLGLLPAFLYVYWYSKLDRSASRLSVGATLPALDLVDADGTSVVPTPGKHGLYMFVRGNWCPLCMAQVREVAAQYRELESRGVEVFLITPQPESNTKALAARFDAPIRFCVDRDNRVARQLGLEHEGGVPFTMEALGYGTDSVLPTVVIVNPERTIVFADLTDNYRVRPEPSTFLAVLDATA